MRVKCNRCEMEMDAGDLHDCPPIVIPPKNQARALTVSDLKQAIDDALAAGLDPSATFSVDDGVLVVGAYGTVHGRWQSDGRSYFAVTTNAPRG